MTSKYPKTYRENMAWRRKLLAKAATDLTFREKVKELFFRDPLFAFNAFFFTLDVRKRPFHMQPFCTYPFQDDYILELIDSINGGEDYLTEKSRDMGVSWLTCLTFLWFWLNPTGGADFLMGSRKEDYVDKKGDMRTLFEKVRYTLYRLPGWLLPKGFKKGVHDNYMNLQNPETGATITGESNNQNYGTGGRYAGILFDEFAKWEGTDEPAWMSAGDATPCRLPVSTPFGAGGKYYNLVIDTKTKKVTMHWTLHPEKAFGLYCQWPPPNEEDRWKMGDDWKPEEKLRSPWYDKEDARRTPLEMAQEIDIDYLGAGNPVFDGKAGKSLAFYRKLPATPVKWLRPDIGTLGTTEAKKPLDPEGYILVFQEFDPKLRYVGGFDVAEGLITGDYSVGKIMCRETGDVVASYYGHIGEDDYANVVSIMGKLYSDKEKDEHPWVGIEANLGPGIATFDRCVRLEVPNLFMMPKYELSRAVVTYRKGWCTTKTSRPILVAGIREYLENRTGTLDLRCVGECSVFVRNKNGRPEAKSGCHDDEVIALGICIQVAALAPYDGYKEEVERRDDKLPTNIFRVEEHPLPPEEQVDESIEGRCLATIVARRGLESIRSLEEAFYDDFDEWG